MKPSPDSPREQASDIRLGLLNGFRNVYAEPHDQVDVRICAVRVRKGWLEGKQTETGKWFTIRAWEVR